MMDRTFYRFLVGLLIGVLLYVSIEYQEERLKVTSLERLRRQDARIIKEQQTEIADLRAQLDEKSATAPKFYSYDECFGNNAAEGQERRYLPQGVELLNEGLNDQGNQDKR